RPPAANPGQYPATPGGAPSPPREGGGVPGEGGGGGVSPCAVGGGAFLSLRSRGSTQRSHATRRLPPRSGGVPGEAGGGGVSPHGKSGGYSRSREKASQVKRRLGQTADNCVTGTT